MKTNLLKTTIVAALIFLSGHLMAFTAVLSGSWSSAATWGGIAPGATVSNNDIIIPNGLTVDMDMNVTFAGLLNSFTVDGTLNSSGSNSLTMSSGSFSGSGTVNIHRISFSGILTTTPFTGTMNLDDLENTGAILTFTSVVNIADTLNLDGGSILLNTSSNIIMMANSNVRVNNGSLSSSGGLFTAANPYNVWYVGTSKTTGLELNSTNLQDMHINLDDSLQTVTQGINSINVHGNFAMPSGGYNLNGYLLTLSGDLSLGMGSKFTSNASSSLSIQGTGAMTSGLVFNTGSSLNNLTINRTGGSNNVNLMSALSIGGTFVLMEGNFRVMSNTSITMNSGSDIQITNGALTLMGNGSFVGTASYNVEYYGLTRNAGAELSGSGLNNVTFVMSGSSESVILSSDVAINGGLYMTIGRLSMSGNDLTLNGTIYLSHSAFLVGDSTSTLTLNLSSTDDTIYFATNNAHLKNLILNIPASSTITMGTDLTIHNQLNMMSGKIATDDYFLHMRPSASITGYSDTKYIVTSGTGQLEMNVNSNSTYVTFPIGSPSQYAPAQIQQTSSGTSGLFRARVMNGVYAQGYTGYNSATTESVVNKTWMLDAAAGVTVNMNMKLGWVVADEVNSFNRNQAYIAHYMNSNWDTYAQSAAVSGSNNTYEIMRTGITSLSPFAVVDNAAVLSVHEVALGADINVYPNPTVDAITIETSAVHGNYLYEVYDATGNLVYSIANSNPVNKIDFSSFTNGFYFVRITNIDTHANVTKRIVKS
jgi:hypothetical protein